jgi:hypothetical protein
LVGVGKFNKQVGDVAGNVGVGPPEMFRETFLGQGAEQLTKRMPWRNLRSHFHLSHLPKTREFSIADVGQRADIGPNDSSIGLHAIDLSRKLSEQTTEF